MNGYRIILRGRVQGVGFRYEGRQVAENLGVAGFMQNERDGSVSIEVYGDAAALDAFLEWCERGPRHAHVETIQKEPIKSDTDYETFEIR